MTLLNPHRREQPDASTGSTSGTRTADSATVVQLPVHPSGATLAAVIREVRLALLRGDVVVDSSRASGWTPGPRLVLDHLQHLTHRAGHRWHDLAVDGNAGPTGA